MKKELSAIIKTCLLAREQAVTLHPSSTKVGAVLVTNQSYYEGFNIQTKAHKDFHAEEVAIINFLVGLHRSENEIPEKLIVTFSDPDHNRLTFPCGHCRQLIWEITQNPGFEIIEIDLKGRILSRKKLYELYPLPYPYIETTKRNGT